MKPYFRLTKSLIAIILMIMAWKPSVLISHADTFFVDKDSIGGACSNDNPGTRQRPWCSFYKKFWDGRQAVKSGDTIFFRAGVYSEQIAVHADTPFDGSENQPITITNYDGEPVRIIGGDVKNGIFIDGDSGTKDFIHISGFEISKWGNGLESSGANRAGWRLEKLHVHDCGRGLVFRNFTNLWLSHSTIHDIHGDGVAYGVGMREGTSATIRHVTVYNIDDHRSPEDSDADGFWAQEDTVSVTLENVVAHHCVEDGIDLKASTIVINGATVYHTGFCGIKIWPGTLGSQVKITNVLVHDASEDGIKLNAGNGTLAHLTSIRNGYDVGYGNKNGGAALRIVYYGGLWNIFNSIFVGGGGNPSVRLDKPTKGADTTVTLRNCDFYGFRPTLVECKCNYGYTADSILNGSFSKDLSSGINCGPNGIKGACSNPKVISPSLTSSYQLSAGSPLVDAGIFDNGIHCPSSGATGNCVTWYGAAPDVGAEYRPPLNILSFAK